MSNTKDSATYKKVKVEENGQVLREFVTNYHTNTPYNFVYHNFPDERPKPHHKWLLDLVQKCTMEPQFVCVSMPPGSSKSTTLSRALAWWIATYPKDIHAYATYGDDLSVDLSRKTRQILQEFCPHVNLTANRVESWYNAQGGGFIATSVGGALTGKRVTGLLVVDDPYKNLEAASSAEYRKRVSDWFKTVALTRLTKGSSVIVVQTRWHPGDLFGELVSEHGYKSKNFPAILANGEALWPEQYNVEMLNERRKIIGEKNFSSLYLGKPVPDGAVVFGNPTFYDPKETKSGWRVYLAADVAASAKKSADFSCAIALGVRGKGAEAEYRVFDMLYGQWTVPDFVRRLYAFQNKWKGAKIGVEAVGGFKAVPQMLREMNPNLRVIEIHPRGDKLQRAQLAAAAWNDGRLQVPMQTTWVEPLISECTRFTGIGDDHDDIVDALSHAVNMAIAASNFQSVPRGAVCDFERYK